MSTDFRGFEPKGLPLVSIVAVAYNHERFLEETLDSIKAQTYPNIQLIIMDDCSQDNSVAKIEGWIERNRVNCKFIAHKKNVGICKTLNEALEYCNGTYYQAFACDDVMFPDKIELQVQEFEKSEGDVMVICSNGVLINESGDYVPPFEIVYNKYITYDDFFNPGRHFFGVIRAGSVLIRKKIFELIGNYDEDLMAEDTDLWLRILKDYKIKYVQIDAYKYRVVKTSMSKTGHKSDKFYYTVYRLLQKQINNKLISKETINRGFITYIKSLYVLKNRGYWCRVIMKNKFSIFICFHYVLASLGLTYNQGVRVSKAIGIFVPNKK